MERYLSAAAPAPEELSRAVSDTRTWGPFMWDVLHYVMMPFHEKVPVLVDDVDRMMTMLASLMYILPCIACTASYVEYFNHTDFRNALLTGQGAVALWHLHHSVTEKLAMQREHLGGAGPRGRKSGSAAKSTSTDNFFTFEQLLERYSHSNPANERRVLSHLLKLYRILVDCYPIQLDSEHAYLKGMAYFAFFYTCPTFFPPAQSKFFYLPVHDETLLEALFTSRARLRDWVNYAEYLAAPSLAPTTTVSTDTEITMRSADTTSIGTEQSRVNKE